MEPSHKTTPLTAIYVTNFPEKKQHHTEQVPAPFDNPKIAPKFHWNNLQPKGTPLR